MTEFESFMMGLSLFGERFSIAAIAGKDNSKINQT
jgi:hypothetical protein